MLLSATTAASGRMVASAARTTLAGRSRAATIKPAAPAAASAAAAHRRRSVRCASDPTGVAQVAIVIATTVAALSAPGPAPAKDEKEKEQAQQQQQQEDAAAAAPVAAVAAVAADDAEAPVADTAPLTIAAAVAAFEEEEQVTLPQPESEAPVEDDSLITIAVFGVGGGGCNAVANMMARGQTAAAANKTTTDKTTTATTTTTTTTTTKYYAVNTDAQALESHPTPANHRIQIGASALRGLGAGGDPTVGRSAALESSEAVRAAVASARADLVFVTAGMGGGTGTGAAPIVAAAAREQGALTVGVVTFPFSFEGRRRQRQALDGIAALRAPGSGVDTLIVVANDRLLDLGSGSEDDNDQAEQQQLTMLEAFARADDVLRLGVEGITELLSTAGLINVDFADVRSVMQARAPGNGAAAADPFSSSSSQQAPATLGVLGTGAARGRDRAVRAALSAASAPLLMCSPISSASGVVFNVQGGPSLTLQEVAAAADAVASLVGPDANVIFGAVVDDQAAKGSKEDEEVRVTLIATGFPYELEEAALQLGGGRAGSRAGAGAWAGSPVPVPQQQQQQRADAAAPQPRQRYDY